MSITVRYDGGLQVYEAMQASMTDHLCRPEFFFSSLRSLRPPTHVASTPEEEARRRKIEAPGEAHQASDPENGRGGGGVGEAGTSSSKDEIGAGSTEVERNKLVFLDAGIYSFDLEDLLRASAEVLGKGSVKWR
ncbi:hypothetical protein Scep_025945 [Stephania cephalantha]|uniref:Uncharacterized protein n=1 Tax=Stephania cephalantha TaxID=152367 RepID=A0AAP0EJ70_9MAGN